MALVVEEGEEVVVVVAVLVATRIQNQLKNTGQTRPGQARTLVCGARRTCFCFNVTPATR